MSRDDGREKPLVAVVATVPLLAEGVSAVLADIAEVQTFPANQSDIVGLLQWLRPDAIVVDREDNAEAAASFAVDADSPLVHISLTDRRLRVLRSGRWEEAQDGAPAPDEIRNILVADLFGRRVAT